jgi:hypothetical protein
MHINVKWGIYAAIAAFLLAFLTSILLGQASFGISVLRGMAFAALFFVLGTGVWTLVNTFIPELLFPDEGTDAAANIFGPGSADSQGSNSQLYGSRINITLADRADAALPDNDGSDIDEVGNISDLVSGTVDPAGEAKRQRGLDEFSENSYTNTGEGAAPSVDVFTEAEPLPSAEGSGGFTMNFDNFAMGGGTSGMDPFGDSFSLPADGGKREETLPERKSIGNTPKSLEGDFNPKDIALGIRTVMENDKKG